MGNIEIKEALCNHLEAGELPAQIYVNPNMIMDSNMVKTYYNHLKVLRKMENDPNSEKAFYFSNLDEKEADEENVDQQKMLSQVLDDFTTGFNTSQNKLHKLNEANHEKFFKTEPLSEEVVGFSKLQQLRFTLLYGIFLEHQNKAANVEVDFQAFACEYMSKGNNARAQAGIKSTFLFVIALLEDLKDSKDTTRLSKILRHLLRSLQNEKPGFLHSYNEDSFLIDSCLKEARIILTDLINDNQNNKDAVATAVKVIFSLGKARANVEDLLVAVKLAEDHKVDIRNEVSSFVELDQLNYTQMFGTQDADNDNSSDKMFRLVFQKMDPLFIFRSGKHKRDISSQDSFAADGQNIFTFQKEKGLIKVQKSQSGGALRVVAANEESAKWKNAALVCHQGKLYVRSQDFASDQGSLPIKVFNTESLEEEKSSFEIEKDANSLAWDEKAGRSMHATPLASDGTYLYAVTTQATGDEEDSRPSLVVEVYDPSTPDLSFVRDFTLTKSEDTIFLQNKNSNKEGGYLSHVQIACNGNVFVLNTPLVTHWFDATTGLRLSKSVKRNDNPLTLIYNIEEDNFNAFPQGAIAEVEKTLSVAKVVKFNKPSSKKVQSDDAEQSVLEPVLAALKEGAAANKAARNPLQFLMGSNDDAKKQIGLQLQEPKLAALEASHQAMSAVILKSMSSYADYFQSEVLKDQINTQKPPPQRMLTFFKFPFLTYLSGTTISTLQSLITAKFDGLSSQTAAARLYDEHSLAHALKILQYNFQALQLCNIKLTSLLNASDFVSFINFYTRVIKGIVAQGTKDEGNDELTQIKQEQYETCHVILLKSANLSSSPELILKELSVQIQNAKTDAEQDACSISLNFLAQKAQMTQVLGYEDELLKQAQSIVGHASRNVSDHASSLFDELKKNPHKTFSEASFSKFVRGCEAFAKAFCNQLILKVGDLSDQVKAGEKVKRAGKLTAKQANALKKQEDVEAALIKFQNYLFEVFLNVSQVHSLELDSLNKVYASANGEDAARISKFAGLYFNRELALLTTVNLFSTTLSNIKTALTWLDEQAEAIGKVIEVQIEFLHLHDDKNKDDKDVKTDSFYTLISNTLRTLCFTIGIISYRLIQANSSDNPNQSNLIVQANLLQGGIESRFVPSFSENTKTLIEGFLKISENEKLHELALLSSGEVKLTQEDEFLRQVMGISEKKDELVEKVIHVLQAGLLKKVPMCPFARLGGEDGLRLARAAFAVSLKFQSHDHTFSMLMQEYEGLEEDYDSLEGAEQVNEIRKDLSQQQDYKTLLSKWEVASQMRKWTQEFKKSVMEELMKQVEEELYQQKAKENEAKAKENSAETINTTAASTLSAQEKETAFQIADERFEGKVAEAYKGVIQKAELLLQLQVPYVFKAQRKGAAGIKRKHTYTIQETDIKKTDSEFDWTDRLKAWKQQQHSSGTVKSFTQKSHEVTESCQLSILACLQTKATRAEIKEQIEEAFVNGCRRVAGLKIIGETLGLSLPKEIFSDVLSWFGKSLRGSKNDVCHYLDGIKGCGQEIEDMARKHFFSAIKIIIDSLRKAKTPEQIRELLEALHWRYQSRDHGHLAELSLVDVLHRGDGEKRNVMRLAWGKILKQLPDQEDKTLTRSLIDTFEFMFMTVVGRIVQPERSLKVKTSASFAGAPGLKQQVSLVDHNVSEGLMGQFFKVLFNEFERYLNILNLANGGIDWTEFVNARNLELKQEKEFELPEAALLLDDEREFGKEYAAEAPKVRKIVELNLHQTATVTAQYDIDYVCSADNRRQHCQNLLTDGDSPSDKWCQLDSATSWVVVDFNGAKHELKELAFRSAEDDCGRDPTHVKVSVWLEGQTDEKEVGAFDLSFNGRLDTTKRFNLTGGIVKATKVRFDFLNSNKSEIQLGQILFFGPKDGEVEEEKKEEAKEEEKKSEVEEEKKSEADEKEKDEDSDDDLDWDFVDLDDADIKNPRFFGVKKFLALERKAQYTLLNAMKEEDRFWNYYKIPEGNPLRSIAHENGGCDLKFTAAGSSSWGCDLRHTTGCFHQGSVSEVDRWECSGRRHDWDVCGKCFRLEKVTDLIKNGDATMKSKIREYNMQFVTEMIELQEVAKFGKLSAGLNKTIQEMKEKADKARAPESLHQLYQESFLQRLLRLVEFFSSVAVDNSDALSMIQRIANPQQLQTLLRLLISGTPKVKVVVLKVLQNLIKLDIPVEIFEHAVELCNSDSEDSATREVRRILDISSCVDFKDCHFLRLLFNYLLDSRSVMWFEDRSTQQGQYAVTNELAKTFRVVFQYGDDKNVFWQRVISKELKRMLLQIQTATDAEIDAIMSLMQESAFKRISAGSLARTNQMQLITVLGFSDKQISSSMQIDDIKKLKLSPEFENDKQKLVGLYFNPNNPSLQEVISVPAHDVEPVTDLEIEQTKQAAQKSPLYDAEVVRHFLKLLAGQDLDIEKRTNKNKLLMIQVFIIKGFSSCISLFGQGYLDFLEKENLLEDLFVHLNKVASQAPSHKVVPKGWHELKALNIRLAAMQSKKTLGQSEFTRVAISEDEKQVIVTAIDPLNDTEYAFNLPIQAVLNCSDPKIKEEGFKLQEWTNRHQNHKRSLIYVPFSDLVTLNAATVHALECTSAIITEAQPKDQLQISFNSLSELMKKRPELYKLGSISTIFLKDSDIAQIRNPAFPEPVKAKTDDPRAIYHLATLLEQAGFDSDRIFKAMLPFKDESFEKIMGERLVEVVTVIQQEDFDFNQKIKEYFGDAENQQKLLKERDEEHKKISDEVSKLRNEAVAETFVQEKVLQKMGSFFKEAAPEAIVALDPLADKKTLYASLIEQNIENAQPDKKDEAKKDDKLSKQFFSEINEFNSEAISQEYIDVLKELSDETCKRTLVDLFALGNQEKLLPTLIKSTVSKKQLATFIQYELSANYNLKVQTGLKTGSKKTKEQITKLLSQLQEHNSSFLSELVSDLITRGKDTLDKLHDLKPEELKKQNVLGYFSEHPELLNPYALNFFVKTLCKIEFSGLKADHQYLKNFFNMLLSFSLLFGHDAVSKVSKSLLKSCSMLLQYVQANLDELAKTDLVGDILSNSLFNKMISNVKPNSSSSTETNSFIISLYEMIIRMLDLQEETIAKKHTLKRGLDLNFNVLSAFKKFRTFSSSEDIEFRMFKNEKFLQHRGKAGYFKLQTYDKAAKDLNVEFKVNTDNCIGHRLFFVQSDVSGVLAIRDEGSNEYQYLFKKDQELKLKSSFEVSYPHFPQQVFGLGKASDQIKYGNQDTSVFETTATGIFDTLAHKHVQVAANEDHVAFLATDGSVWKNGAEETKPVLEANKFGTVKKVVVGPKTLWILTDDGKVYVTGEHEENQVEILCLEREVAEIAEYTSIPLEEGDSVEDLITGFESTVFLSKQGHVYGLGKVNSVFQHAESEKRFNKVFKAALPEDTKAKKVWINYPKGDLYPVVFVKAVTSDGVDTILSTGFAITTLRGRTVADIGFMPLQVDFSKTTFVDIVCTDRAAYAIDNEAKLWMWGESNEMFKSGGLDIARTYKKPTEFEQFSKLGFKVNEMKSEGNSVLFRVVDAEGKQSLQAIVGKSVTDFRQFGKAEKPESEDILTQLTDLPFTAEDVLSFELVKNFTYFIVKDRARPAAPKHELPEGKQATGLLHFYQQEGKWVYVTSEEYAAKKNDLPNVCFAIRAPITNLEAQEFPDLEEILTSFKAKHLKKAFWRNSDSVVEDEVPAYFTQFDDKFLTEQEMIDGGIEDMQPKVYYRVKTMDKNIKSYPPIDHEKIYQTGREDKDLEAGYLKMSVIANIVSFGEKLPSDVEEACTKRKEIFSKLPTEEKAVKKMLRTYELDQSESTFIERVKQIEEYKDLQDDVLQGLYENKMQMKEQFHSLFALAQNQTNVFSKYFSVVKTQVFSAEKQKLLNDKLESIPSGPSPNIRCKRVKAARFADSGKVDYEGEHTIFGQCYQQIKKNNPTYDNFAHSSTDERCWVIEFLGEGSMDYGGPFRDSLVNICTELEEGVLSLIVKSPNNRNEHGTNRDCYVLNSQATSPTEMELFKFFGGILGFAIRSQSPLPINLPPTFWKQIIGEQLTLQDLEKIDAYSFQVLQDLQNYSKSLSDQEFEAVVDEQFVTILTSGQTVPLCAGGASKQVTKENMDEYIELVVKTRFNEASEQLEQIKKGINCALPVLTLSLISPEEVEIRACGEKSIDVERLKSITSYPYCSDDHDIVKRWWRVFEAFSDVHKSAYLKFVWGRARLPNNLTNLSYKHEVRLMESQTDASFPQAHTCFFQLDIPGYTTDEICRSRLVTAIELCGEIDTDMGAGSVAQESE